MHTFYLRNMYIRNALVEPGGITLAGQPIDLDNIDVPACFVSTVEDHIAPWKSTFLGAKRLPGPVRMIVGGSGHIAGVVNPPSANKYHYWRSDELAGTADEWLARAQRRDGSWWPEWSGWVSRFGGEKVPARVPGDGKLKVIEDAPGSYAKVRLDAGGGLAQASQVNAAAPAAKAATHTEPAARRAAPALKPVAANDPTPPPAPQSAIDLLSAAAEALPQPLPRPASSTRETRRPPPQDPAHAPGKRHKKAPK